MSRKYLIIILLGAIVLVAAVFCIQIKRTNTNPAGSAKEVGNSGLLSEFDDQSSPITTDMFK